MPSNWLLAFPETLRLNPTRVSLHVLMSILEGFLAAIYIVACTFQLCILYVGHSDALEPSSQSYHNLALYLVTIAKALEGV